MMGAVVIRADATERMGTGHLMRCMALATACVAAGGRVEFVTHCPDSGLRHYLVERGFAVHLLPAMHPEHVDLEITLATLQEAAAKSMVSPWLVLDGYHFDPSYQQSVRKAGFRLLVVDDCAHLSKYHADFLLNQNPHGHRLDYRCDPDAKQLLGPRYALFRPEFQCRAPSERRHTATHILVTMGGSDPDGATLKVIRGLRLFDMTDLKVRVVAGAANTLLGQIRREAKLSRNVEVLTNVGDMAAQMSWADLAISAAGTTCYELALAGVPSLLLSVAKNQEMVARQMAELGVAINLGDAAQVGSPEMVVAVRRLIADLTLRSELSELGQMLFDGKGAERVAAMLASEDIGVSLRPAAADDAFLYWQWANDPTVRSNSFCPDPIPWPSHVIWFRARLAAAGTRMWVLESGLMPVGQIRCDRRGDGVAEISFTVDARWRGKGFGSRLLTMAGAVAARELGVRTLEGVAFAGNEASIRAFAKAGFSAQPREVAGRACQVFRREYA